MKTTTAIRIPAPRTAEPRPLTIADVVRARLVASTSTKELRRRLAAR